MQRVRSARGGRRGVRVVKLLARVGSEEGQLAREKNGYVGGGSAGGFGREELVTTEEK